MNIHGCELFPEPTDVFAERVDEHRSVLLPFMVMPLSLIVPGSSIRVPWVIPHEPYDGCVGQQTQKYHTFFSRKNWVGFQLIDGKLRFDSDLAFFIKYQMDHLPPELRTFPHYDVRQEERIRSHQKIEQRFEQCRDAYRKGPVSLMESHFIQHTKHRMGVGIFDQLGGHPTCGNWAKSQEEPYFREESEYPEPVDESGRGLIYLGSVNPRINHADQIVGFINEDLDRVVFTYDFS